MQSPWSSPEQSFSWWSPSRRPESKTYEMGVGREHILFFVHHTRLKFRGRVHPMIPFFYWGWIQ